MRNFSDTGRTALDDAARSAGFSAPAAESMLHAIERGGGRMAQFSHPEFGGSGQWMAGGMTMVGDMFNDDLKGRVNQLCHALAKVLDDPRNFDAAKPARPGELTGDDTATDARATARSTGSWWPSDLGSPSSTGSQNAMRYAYFPQLRRLALDNGGTVRVYDTQDHDISGFSQQQSTDSSIKLSSQHGPIDITSLPVVSR